MCFILYCMYAHCMLYDVCLCVVLLETFLRALAVIIIPFYGLFIDIFSALLCAKDRMDQKHLLLQFVQ